MAGIALFQSTLEDVEQYANAGRNVTIGYLVAHEYLSKEKGQEVLGKLVVLARKPSWFQKLLNWRGSSDNGIRFHACTVEPSVGDETEGREEL